MRRLTDAQSDALLTVMRECVYGPFHERQALSDLEAILGEMPRWAEASAAHPRKQGGKTRLRVLAEAFADVYLAHTGGLPGISMEALAAEGKKRKMGGPYPRCIEILAKADGQDCTWSQIVSTCNTVRQALEVRAGNVEPRTKPRKSEAKQSKGSRTIKPDKGERKKASSHELTTHSIGDVEDFEDGIIGDHGDTVFDKVDNFVLLEGDAFVIGYEPARDPDAKSVDIFAKAARAGLSKKR